MRGFVATLAIMFVANSVRCSDADRKPPDEEFLRNYMAGEYDLIGREADSTATYSGHVECIFLSTARSMTPRTAGNLILTTTRDLRLRLSCRHEIAWPRSTFPNPPMIGMLSERKAVTFDFTGEFSMLGHR